MFRSTKISNSKLKGIPRNNNEDRGPITSSTVFHSLKAMQDVLYVCMYALKWQYQIPFYSNARNKPALDDSSAAHQNTLRRCMLYEKVNIDHIKPLRLKQTLNEQLCACICVCSEQCERNHICVVYINTDHSSGQNNQFRLSSFFNG